MNQIHLSNQSSTAQMRSRPTTFNAEYLLARSAPEPNTGCWLWMGATTAAGYGRLETLGKKAQAHRTAYALFVGPIPNGLLVCHKCDVRSCINPDHLFLGSAADNTRDMIRKGRDKMPASANRGVTHCKRGHEFTPGNTRLQVVGRVTKRTCRECALASQRARYRTLAGRRLGPTPRADLGGAA